MTNGKVTKLAISSRIILLCVQLISNVLIPDHNPDVFKSPKNSNLTRTYLDKLSEFFFGGFKRWDAEYFLHIAEHGYTYENNLAFYPLYPGIIHWCTKIAVKLSFYMSFSTMSLMISILLNIYFFHRAANCLYDLTQRIFGDANKAWMAVVLFCFNPASIFFSAPYSESLYCWLSFSLMLCCVNHIPFVKTTTVLGLSILCRSNGFLNIGYPIYFTIRKIILKKSFWEFFKLIAVLLLALIPFSVFNFYMFQNFCLQSSSDIKHENFIEQYAKRHNYVLAGNRSPQNSPWCDDNIPFPYSYVQNHYWDLGFLNYYKIKQIPNFLLASPILLFLFVNILKYFEHFSLYFKTNGMNNTIKEWKSLPFVLHCLILLVFCTLFVYIQISTRLLASANPCLFWFAADCLPKTFDQINFKRKNALIIYWFGGYFLIGTILFCNFYPWT